MAPGGLVEVCRLPALSTHYQEHFVESSRTMTWSEFLILHYTDPDHDRKDAKRHGKLPLHYGSAMYHYVISTLAREDIEGIDAIAELCAPLIADDFGYWMGRSVFHPPKHIS